MPRRTTAPPPVLPGYTYIRPLGAGGFADVFLYEQDMPRRVVAVKVLLDDGINPDVLAGFTSEADILARLSAHPSIVSIYQASISADGRPYFVMEHCPDTLGAEMKRAPLPVDRALDAGVRMASALETAHRSGVLHRDINPSNVLVTSLGSPVLADFGIASAIAAAADAADTIALSLPWSAPEVVRGDVTGTVSSELWSLRASIYTLLAGRAPFELPTGERIGRRQHEERILKGKYVPTGRDDLGERLAGALEKCLMKDPGARFGSMLELAEELRWAQFELSLAPTALEIATPEWAAAAAPAPDDAQRTPTISTVRSESRRAARAQTLASAQRREERAAEEPPASRKDIRTILLGAGIGAAVVALGAILLAVW